MKPDMMIFYATDVAASAAFYQQVLGKPADELSPAFAMFALPSGLKFGLWKIPAVQPETEFVGSGAELVLHVSENEEADAAHAAWSEAGVSIIYPPTQREFGYSFVAADPDGHRVRVLRAAG